MWCSVDGIFEKKLCRLVCFVALGGRGRSEYEARGELASEGRAELASDGRAELASDGRAELASDGSMDGGGWSIKKS